MDWKLCVICQKVKTGEPLQCPAISKRKDVGASYSSFARNLEEFQKIGSVPANVNIEELNEGQGIEHTLKERKASWHKTCRNAFSNEKIERAKKRKHESEKLEDNSDLLATGNSPSPVKARRSSFPSNPSNNHCFFCESIDSPENLHSACTLEVDRKVRECASLVNDSKLIGKLASGDMVATEAKYHVKCLVNLYNNARKVKCSSENASSSPYKPIDMDELAFAKLVAFTDESLQVEEPVVLKLSDLVKFYSSKLSELGEEQPTRINATRLKTRLLTAFPDLTAHTQGREVLFVLSHEIRGVLLEAKNRDSEAYCLAKAAMIVRREILQVKNSFNGTFAPNCQTDSVPASLTTLLDMIMRGPAMKKDSAESQACLTVAQLLVFNSISRFRDKSDNASGTTHSTHHIRGRECPLPIYAALKILGATREKSLVDIFYKLGMCISYDRLLSISSDITNSVIDRYDRDGVVCPSKLRDGIFTTAALDNIDHNPSSTSSHDSFHGTAISLAQHPTAEKPGTERSTNVFDPEKSSKSKKIAALLSYYTEVPPLTLPSTNIVVPNTCTQLVFVPDCNGTSKESEREEDWLKNIQEVVTKKELSKEDTVSWAAYRASKSSLSSHQPALISLLPMFTENAHSLAMIAHGINVISAAVKHLNPSQTAVVTVDQPLFALAKEIQWTMHEFDESHIVVMLGGLHIEMAAFKALGKWVHGSGWTEALTNASVVSSGVADSFLSASHITRTRRAHQVTAASLHILMNNAYEEYSKSDEIDRPARPFKQWKDEKMKKCPQFLYWATVQDFELLCLQLVRAFREADFSLYLKAIQELLPWMFALDSHKYARWLSVHYRDMCELPVKHPDVCAEFRDGAFVVHKTKRLFSSIALDHAHEQVNAIVKGEGGAVGLTENPAALRRWMVAGPELSRMVDEFEEAISAKESQKHHEQNPATQSAFAKDVLSLVSSFEELGNPFKENGEELTALHTKDVMNEEVVHTVRNARQMGEQQCKAFFKERLEDKTKLLKDTLKKNNLPMFNDRGKKILSKDKAKVTVLKEDCTLFSRLYIACQNCDGNLEDFFKFENQPWPPSLSQLGQLRGGTKADLVTCLSDVSSQVMEQPSVDAIILDGAVVVQMLQPKAVSTFEEYFESVFAPYILRKLNDVKRLDIVWDVYKDNSLKKATREKRGSGQRRKVLLSTRIPSDWKGFLRVDDNKDELFKLLSTKVRAYQTRE